MDWTRLILLGGQIAVLGVLGALVCLGHDSAVTDGLMVVAGSIAGVGLYQTVKKSP